MPCPALAIVLGVSDAAKLTAAGEHYLRIINDLLAGLREINPHEMPKLEVPKPKVTEHVSGSIYSWQLPKQCGVTKQIAPTVAIGKKVAVLCYSPEQAERLLTPTAFQGSGVLEQPDQPAAVVGCLNIAELIEAARPWIHLALSESDAPEDVVEQVDTVINVLKTLRTATSRQYFADGAMVTHSLLEVRDLP